MIITDRTQIDNKCILLMTSIGGSPIHEGHTRLIRDCKRRAILEYYKDSISKGADKEIIIRNENNFNCFKLLVIVNCDDFLLRKHGFSFQSEDSRAEVLDSIKDVDYTFIHQSDKQIIDDAIHYFQPHYFLKGGDRSSIDNLPKEEVEACKAYGTTILFGVGGSDKANSSSDLMKRCANHYVYDKPVKDWLENRDKYQYKDLMEYSESFPKSTLSDKINYFRARIDRFQDSKFY